MRSLGEEIGQKRLGLSPLAGRRSGVARRADELVGGYRDPSGQKADATRCDAFVQGRRGPLRYGAGLRIGSIRRGMPLGLAGNLDTF